MKIATAKQMQDLDRRTIDQGIPGETLMENAGNQVLVAMESAYGTMEEKTVTVVCGKGNNGGDGFVLARSLISRGAQVHVYTMTGPAEIRGDALIHFDRLHSSGGTAHVLSDELLDAFGQDLSESDFVVDAILGTGLSSDITGPAVRIIGKMNEARRQGARIISVDIPSGLHADSGRVMGTAVTADLTVTFGLPKRGHFLAAGPVHTGRLEIVDVGIPAGLIDQADIPVYLVTEDSLASHIIPRTPDSHKGTFGHVLVVAGSTGKSGAAVLASLSALRAGAGLVTLATPRSVESALHPRPPEVMTLPLPETPDQTLSAEALDPLIRFSKNAQALAIGPGLSTHPETSELVRNLISRIERPIVIDADALNALAGHPLRRVPSRAAAVLTPHPGEMSRLCGRPTREIQEDRLETARTLAVEWGVILVLKGVHTVTALPAGGLYVNSTGNPGMATAGTGDVLAGVIAGLIAQGYDTAVAARLGVYAHGLAGDLAARSIGKVGLIASDVAARIPAALQTLFRADAPLREGRDRG